MFRSFRVIASSEVGTLFSYFRLPVLKYLIKFLLEKKDDAVSLIVSILLSQKCDIVTAGLRGSSMLDTSTRVG